jgi:hypothetical protein
MASTMGAERLPLAPETPKRKGAHLGDTPGFDDWVNEVTSAVDARRRAASLDSAAERENSEQRPDSDTKRVGASFTASSRSV